MGGVGKNTLEGEIDMVRKVYNILDYGAVADGVTNNAAAIQMAIDEATIHGGWGNGEPIFINTTYRNENRNYTGKIRNITFDHIYMKAESSVFLAGEEDARIENITISDLEITMCSQGTRESGFLDEQPSLTHVYPHSIPAVYARSVDGLRVSGRVRYEGPYSSLLTVNDIRLLCI